MDQKLGKKYIPQDVETGKYDKWLDLKLFKPSGKGTPFSIILPPPNVTGHLHLGHAWDVALQDTIIRFKKLKGYRTLWVPGTDHAGIATQTKFEKILKETRGLTKDDLGRDAFLKELMVWKDGQATFIRSQWAKLGLALDYNSEVFTMDDNIKKAVNKVFVDLYNNKLIYRGLKLVNWDPVLQSAISNIEVISKPTKSKMYYIKYRVVNKPRKFIEIATTRPETMFGDTAIVVNPNDKRYSKLIDEKVINPANDKIIPIIADKYIDMEFGTGAMKCTPAHDFHDNEIGTRHKLPLINILNDDGTMNKNAGVYENLDRFECRKKLVSNLQKQNSLIKIEAHENQVGYSERTNTIVEPYLSTQWFVKMDILAKKVAKNQKSKTKNIDFYPERFNNTILTWLGGINDWCISRQLWWGHQIPVWYNKKSNETYVGLKQPVPINEWVRDKDVLDTWFSSALWPFATLGWPKESKKFNDFFPTDVLVTGYDIIFFWVSRMMMQSNYFLGQKPFKHVLIHGLIRDEQGRKMSKSLGNGIDPMDVIDEYGADALRLFLTSSSTIGEDLNYSPTRLASNWNFINKLWNSARFIFNHVENNKKYRMLNSLFTNQDKWILHKLNETIREVSHHMKEYNFVISTKILEHFIWNDFCNFYIEFAKQIILNPQHKNNTIAVMLYVLKQILILLHPQCPFVTEEIYDSLPNHKCSIMKETWPKIIDVQNETNTDNIIQLIDGIRKLRADNNIPNKTSISFHMVTKKNIKQISLMLNEINLFLIIVNAKICNVSNVGIFGNKLTQIVGPYVLEVAMEGIFNIGDEVNKINKQIDHLLNEVARSKQILSNKNFISKAPKSKVDIEQNKLLKYEEQLKNAHESLESLKLTK